MASNTENVSIWWRHNVLSQSPGTFCASSQYKYCLSRHGISIIKIHDRLIFIMWIPILVKRRLYITRQPPVYQFDVARVSSSAIHIHGKICCATQATHISTIIGNGQRPSQTSSFDENFRHWLYGKPSEWLLGQPVAKWRQHDNFRCSQWRKCQNCEIPLIHICMNSETVSNKSSPSNSWWSHQMETFSAILAICAGIHQGPLAQRPVTRSFDVSLICAWLKGWVNNREAGDLIRHRAHYDFTVMMNTNRS